MPGTLPEVGVLWEGPVGYDLTIRNVAGGPALAGMGLTHRVRLSRDESGRTLVDELSLQGRVVGLTIRPVTGDRFDLSVLGGRWDQNVYGLALPWTHVVVFVPLHLVGVGFSDTDADTDSTLRYYAAAGGGAGADWLFRVTGPLAVRLRAEGAGDTMHRLRDEERDQVRHELWTRGEADLVFLDPEVAFTFGAWAEFRSQWEPRDAPDGVDRQVIAGGLRFGVRLFRDTYPFGGDVPDASPGNERATMRAERRFVRNNDSNGRAIAREPDLEEALDPPPPPATPEEAESHNADNETRIGPP